MNLSHDQKKFIKQNYRKFKIQEMSAQTKLPENEIKKYIIRKFGGLYISPEIKNDEVKQNILAANGKSLKEIIKSHYVAFILLFIFVIIAYINSVNNAFVSDDLNGIARNQDLGKLSFVFSSWRSIFNSLIYYLLFHIGGLSPAVFRTYNILLHLGCVYLIYLILLILSSKQKLSFFAASLFAVHPLLIEAVGWISGRPYTQYSFLLFLAFLLYIRSKNNIKTYFFSVLCFILAVLSSEKAIIFPLILLLYDFSFGQLKQNWKKLACFFSILVVGAIYFGAQISERTQAVLQLSAGSAGQMLNPLTQIPIAITSYLELLFWPAGLTLYHSEMTFSQTNYMIRAVLLVGFLLFTAFMLKKNRLIFFFLSFFLISLLPTLTPFGISWIVAERYAYFGSIGIFFVVAYFFDKLSEMRKFQSAVYITFAIIFIALLVRTISRNIDWQNEDNLWIATAKTSPSSQNTHNNMGDVYARHKDFAGAEREFKKAIEINPNYADAWHNLALTYQNIGRSAEAVKAYEKAVEINPKLWQSYENLTVLYLGQNDYMSAENSLEKLIEINPQNANYYVNMGIVKVRLNDKVGARENFNKALQIDPQNQDALQWIKETEK